MSDRKLTADELTGLDAAYRESVTIVPDPRDREIASLQLQLKEAQGRRDRAFVFLSQYDEAIGNFKDKLAMNIRADVFRWLSALPPAPNGDVEKVVCEMCGGTKQVDTGTVSHSLWESCPRCSATDDRETCDHDNDPATCPECHGPFGVGA